MDRHEALFAIARHGKAPLDIEAGTIAAPGPGELLVKIAGTGICHTDLSVRDQSLPYPLPAVLGHEGAGSVAAVGAGVEGFAPGDHVVLSFNSCGECVNCRGGAPALCRNFYTCNFVGDDSAALRLCDGQGHHIVGAFFGQSSFGTHALVSARSAVKVDKAMPIHLLGPLGCGVQTGAGAVLNSLKAQAGSTLAIFGAGSVGLSALLAAKIAGCSGIVVIDPKASRRALALELGATAVVDSKAEDAVQAVLARHEGGVDYSLECTGIPAVLRQAFDVLAVPGTCGAIGAAPFGAEVSLDVNSILSGRTIVGIVEGDSVPAEFIPRLIAYWREGRFPFDKLIATYPLRDVNRAIEDMESGAVVKPVLLAPPAEEGSPR